MDTNLYDILYEKFGSKLKNELLSYCALEPNSSLISSKQHDGKFDFRISFLA